MCVAAPPRSGRTPPWDRPSADSGGAPSSRPCSRAPRRWPPSGGRSEGRRFRWSRNHIDSIGDRFIRKLHRLVGLVFRAADRPPVRPTGRLSARPPRSDRHERLYHLTSPLEHAARVVVAQYLERFVQRTPLAGGDPFVQLRTGFSVGTLEQE